MDKPELNLHFRLMAITYKLRDIFTPPEKSLRELEIRPGAHALDFGCGPGSYTIPLAESVGKSGKVYALDIHPLAIRSVQRLASKKQLANIETILSDCKTGLPDNSLDVVLFYDTLHDLSEPDKVLEELHRVLKPDGILSFSDHHLKEEAIVSRITHKGLFKLLEKAEKTCSFSKNV